MTRLAPPPLADVLTYDATAAIWARESRFANDGIPPPPLVTCATTVCRSGASWSRFGPITHADPAAASVWQPPQPALEKTRAPELVSAFLTAGTGALDSRSFDWALPPSLPQPAAAVTANTIAAAIDAPDASRFIGSP